MKPKVGIIGDGNVGSHLRTGLERAGYEVEACGHEPERVKKLAKESELVILAIPYEAREEALDQMGDAIRGKTLVDVTNPVTSDYQSLAVEPTVSSGAEEIARKAHGARVVKAFNTVFAPNMDKGKVKGERLTALVAGDDAEAKRQTLDLGRDLGFDPVDAGPLRNARWLESLALLNMQLGMGQDMGTEIGFKLVH